MKRPKIDLTVICDQDELCCMSPLEAMWPNILYPVVATTRHNPSSVRLAEHTGKISDSRGAHQRSAVEEKK